MNWSLKDHKQHSYLPASDINLDPVPVTNKPRPHCLLFISRSRVVLPPWVSTTPCQMSVILDRQTSPAPCAVLDIFETHSCSQATRIARGMEKKRLAVLILEQPPPLSSTASQLPQEDYWLWVSSSVRSLRSGRSLPHGSHTSRITIRDGIQA